jgi:UDP-N-acetylglucosamine--dolichyl-phosphate N-acetylglucosaminephosphotransferase
MIIALLAGFLVAVVVTFLIMPSIIRTMKKAGMVGPDMNKPNKPEIAEMGGVGVLIGFFSGIFTTLGIIKFVFPEPLGESRLLLASMFAILGAAHVGTRNDLFGLRQRIKGLKGNVKVAL